jgi:hypothetical protein
MSKTSLGVAIALALTIPLTVVAHNLTKDINLSMNAATEKTDKALSSATQRNTAEIAKNVLVDKPAGEEAGQLIPGKGIFLGVWSPKDRDGVSLGKTFNLFAAPYDLGLDENGRGTKQILTYSDTVKAVSRIRNLMGHDGAGYKNDSELYAALKNSSYKGEWFIPTREMIAGMDIDGKQVQTDTLTDTLFAHKDTGAFKNTFRLAAANGSVDAYWYWSCSERRDYSTGVYGVRLFDGPVNSPVYWLHKDAASLSSRLLRAELRP